MSKPTTPVSLNILGKEYKIACAQDEKEGLIQKAQELDRQMRKIRDTGKVAGTDRIAVLAALNLAHDSGTAKDVSDDDELCSRLQALCLKIEKVLENP